jgi:predicted lipoprotein with Yx(FWY)xxD motif
MKVIAFGIAALLVSTVSAFAMDPVLESVVGGTKIYTDPKGMTLYTNDKDGIGATTCYGQCSVTWVPFAAVAGAVSQDDDWTLVDRTDGTKMWAHHGKPLYTYLDDKKPGDTLGKGKSPEWHVATPD